MHINLLTARSSSPISVASSENMCRPPGLVSCNCEPVAYTTGKEYFARWARIEFWTPVNIAERSVDPDVASGLYLIPRTESPRLSHVVAP